MLNERYRGLPYCTCKKNNLNVVLKKGLMNAETYPTNSSRMFWVSEFLFLEPDTQI